MKWQEIFEDEDGKQSCKRWCGTGGWILVGLIELAVAIITEKEPPMLNEYMYTSAVLIGLATVKGIIHGGNTTVINENKEDGSCEVN